MALFPGGVSVAFAMIDEFVAAPAELVLVVPRQLGLSLLSFSCFPTYTEFQYSCWYNRRFRNWSVEETNADVVIYFLRNSREKGWW